MKQQSTISRNSNPSGLSYNQNNQSKTIQHMNSYEQTFKYNGNETSEASHSKMGESMTPNSVSWD